jgi:hypothetical protein
MERRPFGKTGERVSVIGCGGIICMNEEPGEAKRLVSQAVDRGISYFDVAPSYGNSEERLGPALTPYRKKVFLACKTGKRTAAEAELASSLEHLKTDHLDLYQHHGVKTLEEVETIMGPGGAMETFVKAREKVLQKAEKKGMARLALKTMAKRKWEEGEERAWPKCWYKPVETYEEAVQAVRFTLSKPVTAAVSPGHAQLLWWMCDAAEHVRPFSAHEEEALARKAQDLETIFPQ